MALRAMQEEEHEGDFQARPDEYLTYCINERAEWD